MSIASRITSIEEHLTDDYNALEGIGADLTNVDKNIENIKNVLADIYDEMPKVTDTGDNLTLENTRKGAMSITYEGQTQQDSTTQGKNWFDSAKGENGFVDNNGDVVSRTYQFASDYIPISSDNSYTISLNTTAANIGTAYFDSNKGYLTRSDQTNRSSHTFTPNSNWKYIRFWVNINGSTALNSTNIADTYNVQLEEGSSATSYEPFIPNSPNPDYPQPIHNVSGDNTIEICGKNLFDKDSEDVGYVYSSTGSYSLSALWNTSDWISVESNSQYTLSFKTTGTSNLFFSEFDKNKTFIQRTSTGLLTPQSNTKYVRLSYKNDLGIYDIQLEKDSTSSEYEPYKGQSQLISLGVENLFDKDNIVKVDNKILNDSGVETNDTNGGYTKMYMPVKPNTTYTISGLQSSGTKRIYFFDSTKTFISRLSGQTSVSTFSFTTPNNCKYIDIQYYMPSNDFSTYQVEIGSKVNSYSAYGTTPIELNKIGNYQDYIYKTDKWYLHKEIGKVVLDGSEDLYTSSGTTHVNFNGAVGYIHDTTRLPCNILSNCQMPNNNIYFYNTGLSLADFKTLLSITNAIVYGRLSTPQEIEITDTTLLEQLETIKRSYDGVTNISQENNDLPFILDVSALKEWE